VKSGKIKGRWGFCFKKDLLVTQAKVRLNFLELRKEQE
jgi:hypothetical protein